MKEADGEVVLVEYSAIVAQAVGKVILQIAAHGSGGFVVSRAVKTRKIRRDIGGQVLGLWNQGAYPPGSRYLSL